MCGSSIYMSKARRFHVEVLWGLFGGTEHGGATPSESQSSEWGCVTKLCEEALVDISEMRFRPLESSRLLLFVVNAGLCSLRRMPGCLLVLICHVDTSPLQIFEVDLS